MDMREKWFQIRFQNIYRWRWRTSSHSANQVSLCGPSRWSPGGGREGGNERKNYYRHAVVEAQKTWIYFSSSIFYVLYIFRKTKVVVGGARVTLWTGQAEPMFDLRWRKHRVMGERRERNFYTLMAWAWYQQSNTYSRLIVLLGWVKESECICKTKLTGSPDDLSRHSDNGCAW